MCVACLLHGACLHDLVPLGRQAALSTVPPACCCLLLPAVRAWCKVKRVDELRTDVSRLELSIGAAKAEYDKIKAANVAETARFAAERRAEYSAMLENFTATQVWQCGFKVTPH
jgi:hypothetical protein